MLKQLVFTVDKESVYGQHSEFVGECVTMYVNGWKVWDRVYDGWGNDAELIAIGRIRRLLSEV